MNTLLPPAQLDAPRIFRSSGSSFAPAFRLLRSNRRRDLEIFYAFCRVIDDLADAPGSSLKHRTEALAAWRAAFLEPEFRGLPSNLCDLIQRRGMNRALFLELLAGTQTDLSPRVRLADRAALDLYCHRVAGVVGRLCLPIFGADEERASTYAETLGRALQYTNILRDTASDRQLGRLYFPLDELAAAGLDENTFFTAAPARQRYLATFAAQAAALFAEAAKQQPAADHAALRPARLMASIYEKLLRKMQADGLRVTDKRYRLSMMEKIHALLKELVR